MSVCWIRGEPHYVNFPYRPVDSKCPVSVSKLCLAFRFAIGNLKSSYRLKISFNNINAIAEHTTFEYIWLCGTHQRQYAFRMPKTTHKFSVTGQFSHQTITDHRKSHASRTLFGANRCVHFTNIFVVCYVVRLERTYMWRHACGEHNSNNRSVGSITSQNDAHSFPQHVRHRGKQCINVPGHKVAWCVSTPQRR